MDNFWGGSGLRLITNAYKNLSLEKLLQIARDNNIQYILISKKSKASPSIKRNIYEDDNWILFTSFQLQL